MGKSDKKGNKGKTPFERVSRAQTYTQFINGLSEDNPKVASVEYHRNGNTVIKGRSGKHVTVHGSDNGRPITVSTRKRLIILAIKAGLLVLPLLYLAHQLKVI